MSVQVSVVLYSMYGHVYNMTEAEARGAEQVDGVEADIYQVPELVPEETLEESGAKKAREQFDHIPVV